MDSEICNVKFQTLWLPPEYCKIPLFSSVSSKSGAVCRVLCSTSPLVFTHFKCVYEARQNKLPKIPWKLCWERFSILCSLTRTFILVSETLGPPASPARSVTWLRSNQTLFFLWDKTFSHQKHCMCCPRCHFYKSEFRSHSSLAHFIICIFLLYRLNIFYVNSWLPPPTTLWTVLKHPTADDEFNCPLPPCLRIFCGLNAYFLNRNWSAHCISQYTD